MLLASANSRHANRTDLLLSERGVSAVVKDARYHAAVTLLFGLLFLLFIVLFGLRLGGT
jgi:hypothetical protein